MHLADDELGHGQTILLLDGVQQPQRVVLRHLRLAVERLLHLVHPATHHLAVLLHQVLCVGEVLV